MKPYVPDTLPAKLWELMRRHPRFQRTARRLLTLQSLRERGHPRKRRWATGRAERILICIGRFNPCAETALRWLAFPPLFIRRVIAFEPGREADLTAGRPVPISTVQVGWGRHPHPLPKAPWTFKPARSRTPRVARSASSRGWPRCLGPEIETVTSEDPRLHRQCRDAIAEWEAHFAGGHQFTLDTPWPDSPPGFQRAFGAQWSVVCGKGRVAETHFFQSWNLGALTHRATEAVNAANGLVRELVGDLDRVRRGESETVCPPVTTKGGKAMREVPQVAFQLTEAEWGRLLQFDALAGRRVFAVPQMVTREDVEPVLAELKRLLLEGLPDARELLGTPEYWKDFLAVDAIAHAESIELGLAIRHYINRSPEVRLALTSGLGLAPGALDRHFHNGALIEPGAGATAAQRQEWMAVSVSLPGVLRSVTQRERPTIKRRVEFMRALVEGSFLRLDTARLLAKPQHKRPRAR